MKTSYEAQAVELLEKANADLEPDLISIPEARARMKDFIRSQRLAAFGVAALARKIDDAEALARATGTSMGKAKETLATSEVLSNSAPLNEALRSGEVSLDQAHEIAKAEASAPGAAKDLLQVAKKESFHVLKDEARRTKLEAEQHGGLAERQQKAKTASHHIDDLGMAQIYLSLEPHIGTRVMARAEAEAERLARAAKKTGVKEDFDKHLADAYANLLLGSGKGRAKRPELVVLVSHEVAKRGWTEVQKGELCKIPGVGPVAPETAKEIARDAFLNGVFYDGKDLRHFKRWGRSTPVEIRVALELGKAPGFKGVRCVDCGNHFRTQFDHIEPVAARGPTAHFNFDPRCDPCHKVKTARDRKAGKLKPQGP